MKLRTSFTLQIAVAALATAIPCAAQGFENFSSGSTGSDGALNFSGLPNGTTVVFNPASYNPPLDPSGNNIFNFTTINIPTGVTVRLSGRNLTGPVYWLATGNVTINGTLDLSGEKGANYTNVPANRTIAYPGAGGYAGGLGGTSTGTAGQGPAGGVGATNSNQVAGAGGFTGNTFLVPLIGGSGGGGGNNAQDGASYFGPGGGAGGGAILIASSTSIACSGTVNGAGGSAQGPYGGGGAGGAIHLIAPAMSGSCSLEVNGGSSYNGASNGASGRIRVETANYTGTFSFSGTYTITSAPYLYLPTITPGTIQAISVNGVNLPASPTGSFATPDVSINTPNSVSVVVQATNIPVGTVVTLEITSEQGSDMTIACPGLSGTLASSTTACTVVFPAGFSRGYVTASW